MNNMLRIGFAGTPDFAKNILQALINNNFNIVLAITQADKKSGRGKKITAPVVKTIALANNIKVIQPTNLTQPETLKIIKDANLDILIVVAFGQILTKEVLNMPKYGCINIHTSLLPRWRGAAPIQRAIEAGDKTTGVCIIQMDEGLDTGDILLQQQCEIKQDDTSISLYQKLNLLAKDLIIKTLNNLNQLKPMPQEGKATYAKKLTKAEALINWDDEAINIHNKIRAFNPYPIAQTYFNNNKVLKIIQAQLGKPIDKIIQNKNQLLIPAKNGSISIIKVQLAGKKVIDIKDFNNANKIMSIVLK